MLEKRVGCLRNDWKLLVNYSREWWIWEILKHNQSNKQVFGMFECSLRPQLYVIYLIINASMTSRFSTTNP